MWVYYLLTFLLIAREILGSAQNICIYVITNWEDDILNTIHIHTALSVNMDILKYDEEIIPTIYLLSSSKPTGWN